MAILPPESRDWQWLFAWEILTILEPRLLDLERALLDARNLPQAEVEVVFRLVRKRVAELVGWSSGRRHPVLRTSDAYHVVIDRLLTIAWESPPQLVRALEARL